MRGETVIRAFADVVDRVATIQAEAVATMVKAMRADGIPEDMIDAAVVTSNTAVAASLTSQRAKVEAFIAEARP